MRPVEKWKVNHQMDANNRVSPEYNPYREAKPILVQNLGQYCSYYEVKPIYRDIQVEHIQPKSLHPDLVLSWDNFLISCSVCNGRDNKGNKDVSLEDCHLPHRNNTFLSLVYKQGGVVIVNPNLSGLSYTRANNLLKLIGLDKSPKESRVADKRWQFRYECWNLAERCLKKYENGEIDVETIISFAKEKGGWSIWFTVFIDKDEVLKHLIDDFPGTAKCCFDSNNHYRPIP